MMSGSRLSAVMILSLGIAGLMTPGVSDAGKFKQAYKGVHGRYIVILEGMASAGTPAASDRVTKKATEIKKRFAGAKVNREWRNALQGLDMNLTPAQAFKLARDRDVALVEQDARIQLQTIQSPVTWGLDRIDQPSLPLSSSYVYGTSASNVTAYVIDTGILATHADFGGRVSSGYSSILNAQGQADYTDCNGHGTHVAGTIGSKTYGVAKEVKLVNVRVLDCNGSGTVSGVIAGINWVTQNRILPAAANLSLGGSLSAAMDLAVRNSIAAGVSYAVAAGNSNTSACSSSPADVTEALTVGATDISDNRSSFSNYGTCVDLFAPGTSILSTWNTSSVATATLSGTSMATPHVTGAAAIFLSGSPAATPSQVAAALVAQASSGKLFNVGAGSPNLLLFTNPTAPVTPPSITPPTVGLTAPTSGQTLSGTVTLSANASDAISVSKVEFLCSGGHRFDITVCRQLEFRQRY